MLAHSRICLLSESLTCLSIKYRTGDEGNYIIVGKIII